MTSTTMKMHVSGWPRSKFNVSCFCLYCFDAGTVERIESVLPTYGPQDAGTASLVLMPEFWHFDGGVPIGDGGDRW